ncbi:MAG TPA: glycosyltransferase family 39 protein [Syntrophorhabdaceae bacterium]|nr:glycosyltransferase family 39 protein [Syntrophorhabdaceae bacterium]
MGYNKNLIQLGAFVLSICLIFFSGLNNHGLWTPDEPRVAEIGREMAESGNFFIPQLNKRPFLEQPPLYYASLAGVFKIAGYASDGLARLPSAIYGLGGVLATFLLAYTLFGINAGIISAFIISTAFEYLRVSHWVIVDSALFCFTFFAMWFFIKAYLGNEKHKKMLCYILFYVFCILSFFVKGLVGIGVPIVATLTFLILDKNIKEMKRMHILVGLLLFSLSLFLWGICLFRHGGEEYLKIFFIDNNLLRFFPGGTSGHHRPFYYYLTEFPAGFMPWSIFIIPAFFYVFSKDMCHDRKRTLFLMCWFFSGFILFSLASTKRILYLLPIFAPISIIIALFIDFASNAQTLKGIYRAFLWTYGFMYLLIGLLFLPAVLYAKTQYSTIINTEVTVYTFAISAILVILSVSALIMLWKNKIRHFFFLTMGALFVFLMFALIFVAPKIDVYKNLKPFAEKIKECIPEQASIYGYKPDETIRGFIPFYTGRYLTEIHDRVGLKSLKEKEDTIYIVIRDKDDKFKQELIEEGFREVFSHSMGMERTSSLFKK